MTPKEKAEELVYQFEEYSEARISDNCRELDKKYCSIQCALIAVDECIHTCVESMIYYWQEVKQEIEKL